MGPSAAARLSSRERSSAAAEGGDARAIGTPVQHALLVLAEAAEAEVAAVEEVNHPSILAPIPSQRLQAQITSISKETSRRLS